MTRTEVSVRSVVTAALGLADDAPDDTPLLLTSLAATRLSWQARQVLGLGVGPAELLQSSTLAGVLGVVGAHREAPDPAVHLSLPAAAVTPPGAMLPLTDLQQAYLLGRMSPDDAAGCHVYRELTVRGRSAHDLQARWLELVARHPALRMRVTTGGARIDPPEPAGTQLPVHDLTRASEAELDAHMARVRTRCEDLTHPRAGERHWQVECTQLRGRVVVHLSIEPLVIDGHSLMLLLAEWAGDKPLIPVGPERLEECLTALHSAVGAPTEDDRAYWRQRLEAGPVAPRALRPLMGSVPVARRAALSATLPAAAWRRLTALAAHWEVSPTALVLSVFGGTIVPPGPRAAGTNPALVLTSTLRALLPLSADDVVGPFTSSVVMPLPELHDGDARVAATRVQEQLWADLAHPSVTGVTAARMLGRAGRAVELPVVFTSMLGLTADTSGLNADVTRQVGQTTGIALDCQVWERAGELHVHWDHVPERFGPGEVEVLFADFVNALLDLHEQPRPHELNELQQAYFVERVSRPAQDWDGCQVHHAFDVDRVDVDRLRAAWLGLLGEVEALRGVVARQGVWLATPTAPETFAVAEVELDGPGATEFDERTAREMAGRAPALGHGPHHRLVVRRGPGRDRIHLQTDLTVLDGRSIHLVVRELLARYAGGHQHAWDRLCRPGPDPIADPAAVGTAREHWVRRVADLPPGPALAPAVPGAGTRRRLTARVGRWPELRRRCEEAGTCPDGVLVAALQAALRERFPAPFTVTAVRWVAELDGRRPGEATRLSWLPTGDGGTSLAAAARRVTTTLREDAEHDALSGLAVLRRRTSRTGDDGPFELPVVHTGLLDLRGAPIPPGIEPAGWLTCTPGVALDSITVDEGAHAELSWDVDPSRFAAGQPEELFDRYLRVVESFADGTDVAAPGGARHDHRHDDRHDDEPDQIRWNRTGSSIDPVPVPVRFRRRVAETPHATAVRWTGGRWTYGELGERASAVAAALAAAGVAPGDAVAISLPRGPRLVAAVFGTLLAGAYYVPVAPDLPVDRAAAMLADTGAGHVLVDADRAGWEPPAGVRPVVVEERSAPATAPAVDLDRLDRLAYVIFTSGTTGRPKGVAVEFRALNNVIDFCWSQHGFAASDVGLNVTALGFDLSAFDLLGLLTKGASVFVTTETEQRDPRRLLEILLTEGITFWNSAPTTLAQLGPLLPAAPDGRSALRLCYLSGDYTPLTLPDRIRRAFPTCRVVSLGGATEATIWSNWYDVGEVDPAWRSIPYGRPIPNARYYVLDDDGRFCPPHVEGDLLIGGDCLSQGYHDRPELTAERFVTDPFHDSPGARMYRTGDRAVFQDDGLLFFRGRVDRQVKLRGFRVELEEVEHHLCELDGVVEASVQVRDSTDGEQRLAAYLVVRDPGRPPEVGAIRRGARAAMPEYMVPNTVCFLDAFPATANGKLDTGALPWPVATGTVHRVLGPGPGTGYGPAGDTGRTAEILRALFADRLSDPTMTVDDDVWDRGATSFTLVQISEEARAHFGRAVPISAMLRRPTCRGIAEAMVTGGAPLPDAPPVPDAVADAAGPPRVQVAPPAPPALAPDALDFFDADAQAAFKAARHWLRRPTGNVRIPLAGRDHAARYRARATQRRFDPGPVGRDAFGAFLSLLAAVTVDGAPRRTYPSPGDTYAVRCYVRVAPGRVEGVPGGWYYHNPVEHGLELVAEQSRFDHRHHFVYNRDLSRSAAFELFLVGHGPAIEPLYGADSDRFLALEAGHISQALLAEQAAHGLALCPVGAVAHDDLWPDLGLTGDDHLLQVVVAGPRPADLAPPGSTAARQDAPAPDQARPDPAQPIPPQPISPQLAPPQLAPPQPAPAPAPPVPLGDTRPEVAVVSCVARLPGAEGLAGWWRRLCAGERLVDRIPAGRRAQIRPDGERLGGWLAAAGGDDPLRHRIAPREWAMLDPQLHLLLDVVGECLPAGGASGRTGLFLAAMWTDHQHTGLARHKHGEPALISATASDATGRVAYAFGLDGPVVAVDTSCSSSLAALHLAVRSIRDGECESAVVAGVNLFTHPFHLQLLVDHGLLADELPRGALDGDRPGWIPAEACVAVLLRRADAATAAGDRIWGVVESSAVGHTGARPGRFAAPDTGATAEVVRRALGNLPADQIGYVEASCSGARLADLAEQEALWQVLPRATPWGTVKPATGHAEAAAGLVQLAKVLHMLEEEVLAPTLAGPTAEEGAGPVTSARPWPTVAGAPRRALINAAGATGSLACVIVREAGATPVEPGAAGAGATDPAPALGPGHDAVPARALLTRVVAEVLGVAESEVRPYRPLGELGMTSLFAQQIAEEVGRRTPLTAARVLQAATVTELADGLDPVPAAAPAAAAAPPDPGAGRDDHDVAVIGLAGRFPQARSVEELWRNLLSGRDAIGPLPAERAEPGWPLDLMVGGFCDGIDAFDHALFRITPNDAATMDPQERQLLEVVLRAFETSGYGPGRRAGHRVGVFVGAMYNEYPFLGVGVAADPDSGRRPTSGSAMGGIANRVSHAFDLRGPSLTVDTMCSSSLVALHLAAQSLRAGECDLAVVAGVNLSMHPNKFLQLDELQMAAADHRCRSFGEGGTGFVPGEGVVAVVCRLAGAARGDGDPSVLVVRGTAVGHGGRAPGYTVPTAAAQADVVAGALRSAGLRGSDLSYVEAHGTGTALGDPIEVAGLTAALGGRAAAGACAMGSLKSNIGHLEAASGLAGLVKVALQMQHGVLVPSLHSARLNPEIDWDRVPLRVVQAVEEWRPAAPGGPRYAGVSSFGAGGTNAHVVAGPPPPPPPAPFRPRTEHLFLLSAAGPEALEQAARELSAWLRERALTAEELAQVAHLLQVGRTHQRHRLAVVAAAAGDLVAALDDPDHPRRRHAVSPAETDRDHVLVYGPGTGQEARAAQAWLDGADVTWPARPPHVLDPALTGTLPGLVLRSVRAWFAPPGGPAPVAVPATLPGAVPPALWTEREVAVPSHPVRDGGTLLVTATPAQHPLVRDLARLLPDWAVVAVPGGGRRGDAGAAVQALPRVDGWLDLATADAPGDDGDCAYRLELAFALAARPGLRRVLTVAPGLFTAPGTAPGRVMAAAVEAIGAHHPGIGVAVVDPAHAPGGLAAAVAEAWTGRTTGRLVLRPSGHHRLEHMRVPAVPGRVELDRGATYVVTGGTSGLGAAVAEHLADLGARRLLLLGRHDLGAVGRDPAVEERRSRVAGLRARGIEVTTASPDLDGPGLDAALDAARRDGPIGGVVHCAGTRPGSPLPLHRTTSDAVLEALRPKDGGWQRLVDATAADPLRFLLAFSSAAGQVPGLGAGVAGYAIANAALDSAAAAAARSGRPATSVAWPPWRSSPGPVPEALTRAGLAVVEPAHALDLLDAVIAGRLRGPFLVAPPDWTPPAVPRDAAASAPALPRPAAGPAYDWLVELVSSVTGLPRDEVEPEVPLADLGLDSIALRDLVARIEALTRTPIDPTIVLEHPTVAGIASRVPAPPGDATAPVPVAPVPVAPVPVAPVPVPPVPAPLPAPVVADVRPPGDGLAVVGMACRFPGGPDLESFWELLRTGQDAVGEVPAGRWDVAGLYRDTPATGQSISRWGGFCTDVESFDAAAFGLTDAQAADLDPAVRMVLETTRACLADAGIDPAELAGQRVGVVVGARMSSYRDRIPLAHAAHTLGGDQNFIAAQVAQLHDLRGAAVVVDSACSSALLALQTADGLLRSGQCDMVLVGGVEVLLDERPYLEFTAARALSATGRCATFSADADGFVPGEGSGMVAVRRLADAVADGDRVRAVIEGMAVGNDGRTMGTTTPNAGAQEDVVRRAWAAAGVSPADAGLLEAHGTATRLGDPVEVRALRRVLEAAGAPVANCGLGSVKSQIGHLLSAAGMAGLIKVVLAVERATLLPTLHAAMANPRLDLDSSPLHLVHEARPWLRPGRRCAGVSAFGLGGSNAHVVVADADHLDHPVRRHPLALEPLRRRRAWHERPGTDPGAGSMLHLDFGEGLPWDEPLEVAP